MVPLASDAVPGSQGSQLTAEDRYAAKPGVHAVQLGWPSFGAAEPGAHEAQNV